jgi:hypothetical protein
MGADLYINSLFEPQRARWEQKFDAAVRHRESLPADSPHRDEAQRQVDHCFEQMRSQGYFRDPYNNWDLLQQFGLSWWSDVIPILDEDCRLTVGAATRLLAMLTEREGVFGERLSALSEADAQYFRDRYVELRQFVNQAVVLGEPIECAL